jgi:hypothetical protein
VNAHAASLPLRTGREEGYLPDFKWIWTRAAARLPDVDGKHTGRSQGQVSPLVIAG